MPEAAAAGAARRERRRVVEDDGLVNRPVRHDEAREGDVRGAVLKVDEANQMLTLQTEIEDNDVEMAFPLTTATKVTINGAPGKLAKNHNTKVRIRMMPPTRRMKICTRCHNPSARLRSVGQW